MRTFGAHTGAFVAILKGQVRATVGISAMVGHPFPPNSGFGESDALPAVWERADQFEHKMKAIKAAMPKLVEAVLGGNKAEIGAAMGAVGKARGGCHDTLRGKT